MIRQDSCNAAFYKKRNRERYVVLMIQILSDEFVRTSSRVDKPAIVYIAVYDGKIQSHSYFCIRYSFLDSFSYLINVVSFLS